MRRATIAILATILSFGKVAVGIGHSASLTEDPLCFRVESQIYAGSEKEPQVHTTTIALGDVMYDYLEKPAEVIIFDKARGRLILLDTVHRTRGDISTEDVERLVGDIRQRARAQTDSYLRFLADPKFVERTVPESEELEFSSPLVTYRVKASEPDDPRIAERYREFCDWSCKLNTLVNPGSRPPFSRLAVNESLAKKGRFPEEIKLTLKPRVMLLGHKVEIRSEHQLIRQLVESDRNRIAQTDQFMATYSKVSFAEYQKKIQTAPRTGERSKE